jgi:hypothetical protein
MAFPEYQDTTDALLAFIYLRGSSDYSIKTSDSYEPLADYFQLDKDDRTMTRDGSRGDGRPEKAWHNYIQWTRQQLVNDGYILPKQVQGIWKLSERGIIKAKSLVGKYQYFNLNPPNTTTASDIEDIELPGKIRQEVYRILRDTATARRLKELHNNLCQLCGQTVKLETNKHYSEAHHIQPLGGVHKGCDIPENIIVLCPNHHVLCDYGAVELDIKNIRTHPKHQISQRFIQYHNEKIFKK